MPKFTKADIDGLVARFESCGGDRLLVGPESVDEAWLHRALYLAAGLNADGSEKAKVVRAVRDVYETEGHGPRVHTENGTWDGTTFTPDKGGE